MTLSSALTSKPAIVAILVIGLLVLVYAFSQQEETTGPVEESPTAQESPKPAPADTGVEMTKPEAGAEAEGEETPATSEEGSADEGYEADGVEGVESDRPMPSDPEFDPEDPASQIPPGAPDPDDPKNYEAPGGYDPTEYDPTLEDFEKLLPPDAELEREQ